VFVCDCTYAQESTAAGTLDAFTFHGYQHSGATVDDIVNGLQDGGMDASKIFWEQIASVHKACATTYCCRAV
jgi:hypothetical protein